VIHTVGPVYHSAARSAPLLRSAYRSSLALAHEHGLASIAFPAISCGIYGYPLGEAAPLALETCRDHAGALAEIHFVLFGEPTYRVWRVAANELL
jgi:O-acetyl-ADP-ribose deacetylase (regulator of RNase III)